MGDLGDARGQRPGKKSGAAADIKYLPRLIDQQADEDIEDGIGIGRACLIGRGNARLLKGRGIALPQKIRFGLRALAPSDSHIVCDTLAAAT